MEDIIFCNVLGAIGWTLFFVMLFHTIFSESTEELKKKYQNAKENMNIYEKDSMIWKKRYDNLCDDHGLLTFF